MKQKKICQKLIIVVFLILSFLSSYAQEYTLTTSAANIISAKALIDLPGVTGNPNAIIVATPLGSTATANPHPIGAWYYSGKWNIFNSDFAVMIAGLTYRIQYFSTAGPNQFVHFVTQANLGSEGSYIDNPALNNKPNAQFFFLQNHSPDVRAGSWLNRFKEKAGYSAAAGKWYIVNIGGEAMQQGSAYNIVMYTGTGLPPNSGDGSCNCPTSTPPSGNAGGDLSGTYPNPSVQKLNGNPLSKVTPAIGQILKWNGTEWAPADDNTGNVSATPANKPSVLLFSQNKLVAMYNPNVNISSIDGLDNKVFTLSQNSRIVFHTVIEAKIWGAIQANSTGVLITVEILNSSNGVVAKATSSGWLVADAKQNLNSTGIGVLPAGTYHTKVSVTRQAGGANLELYTQPGQMIIEIFPD